MAAAVVGIIAAGEVGRAAALVLALEVAVALAVVAALVLEVAVLEAVVVAGGAQADFQVEAAVPPVVEELPVVGSKLMQVRTF